MEATAFSILRPAARRCLASTRTTTLKQQLRHKATAARNRRALNIPPHPSFLGGGAGADSELDPRDTIIFNPPSSAPSVYHTPFKFLPKTDPRRQANLASLFEGQFGPSSSPPGNTAAAPTPEQLPQLRTKRVDFAAERGPLTKDEVAEMRRLRTEDPHTWSVRQLSLKYHLPKGFVMAICQAPDEKIDFERKKMELMRERWGPAKRKAKEDRSRRWEMLFNGEL